MSNTAFGLRTSLGPHSQHLALSLAIASPFFSATEQMAIGVAAR